MKRFILSILALFVTTSAFAQSGGTTTRPTWFNGTTQNYISSATPLPISGSFSAAGFTPNGNYANLTATNASASVALPAASTVVGFQNTGTTTVSCNLGVGSATAAASQIQVPPSSTVFITVGSNTFGACIDQTGSTSNLVALVGGTGQGSGFGGGGGGSGGTSNVTQVAGTAVNAAVAATGALPIDTLASGNLYTAITSATPAGTNRVGYVSDDPCTQKAKTNLAISQNGTSSVQLIALSGSTVIYVCSLSLIAAGATTVSLTTGTGSACVTGNAAVLGTTTANIANSLSLAANGGLTLGNGGGTIAQGAASSELCMINGSNVFVSGNLTYVQQ